MVTHNQEAVDDMQAALLAGEGVFRPAARRIALHAQEVETLSPEMKKALMDSWRALRRQMIAFHSLAAVCSISTGIAPQSVDPNKDDDDDGGN